MAVEDRDELGWGLRPPSQGYSGKQEEVVGADDDAQEIPLLPTFFTEAGEACTSNSKQSAGADEEDLRHSSIETPPRRRLASLDVFRGLTIAVMILVDDAGGSWPSINHSPWHGVTLADFVMPFFLFIVGMSLVLAFKNTQNKLDALQKAGFRALKLFVLGVLLQGGYFHGHDNLNFGVDVKHLRIMGILQRISIAYFLVACCEVLSKDIQASRKKLPSFQIDAVKLLMMYPWHWAFVLALSSIYLAVLYGLTVPDWLFKTALSNKFTSLPDDTVLKVNCDVRGDLGPACNAVGFFDRAILGINHLYKNPMYRRTKNHERRLYEWIASGFFFNVLGIFIEWLGMPINKPLYTISYVCITGGAAGLLFSAIYVLVDVWNYRKSLILFEWMGMNALLIFVLAPVEVFPALIQGFYWDSPQDNLVSLVEVGFFQHLIHSKKWAKMAYVMFEILFWGLIAGLLKRWGIFWKL